MSEPEKIVRGDSGAQQMIGYEVHIFADRAEAHLNIEDKHLNRRGYLHGGITALLIDSSCGYASSRALSDDVSQPVVSLNIEVAYLAPGEGKSLKAVARARKVGRSIVFCNVEITRDDGTLIATGNGVFKAVKGRLEK